MNSFKKILTDSPKFKFFHLTVTHFEETENLINAWGAPYEFEDSQHWFFRTKHSNIQERSIDTKSIPNPNARSTGRVWQREAIDTSRTIVGKKSGLEGGSYMITD
ncbi:hypothetical protein B9Z55_020611 [Caenorhabditis nigoni]|uniref:Uncharacterized protein n=1 Tax=Caenorhabditis nigoni TaxID=1611254 RepID=A0A2G5TND3_9PELO|nr:hypothetical protein B9Z55_020611 [Caenorhabditis nigoni]